MVLAHHSIVSIFEGTSAGVSLYPKACWAESFASLYSQNEVRIIQSHLQHSQELVCRLTTLVKAWIQTFVFSNNLFVVYNSRSSDLKPLKKEFEKKVQTLSQKNQTIPTNNILINKLALTMKRERR